MSTVAPPLPDERNLEAKDNSDDEHTVANGTEGGLTEGEKNGLAVGGGAELNPDPENAVKPAPPGMPSFPEGGLKAWLTVAGAFLVLFSTFGYINAFGVYESYYIQNQLKNETSSNISWIGSIQLWLQFTLGAVAGPLFDQGYFRYLLGVGSVIYVLGLFLTSITKTYWQVIITQGIIQGIGLGIMFLPAIGVVGHYFLKKRGIAMGVVVVGSSLGGVIFPIMLNRLFAQIGFGSAVRATAYLILGCLVIANLIMSPRLPGRKKGTGPTPPSPKAIFAEPLYAIACVGFFLVAEGIFFPFFYLQVYAEANHLSETIAFYSLAMLNAASIFGRTIPNALADKTGFFNMQILCSGVASILVFAMFGAKTPAGAVVFAILYGFFSGGYVSLMSPALASTANHVSEIGIRIGLAMMCVGLAALSGTPICGALLQHTNNGFYAPIIFSGVCMMSGTALLGVSRTLLAKKKGTWKV